jgi:hypothetical protein
VRGMGAQDLPRRRSLGERGPANEANAARSSAQNPPLAAALPPPLLAPLLLAPHQESTARGKHSAAATLGSASTPMDKAARRCGRTAESAREDVAVRRSGRNKTQRNCVSKKKESGDAVNSGRWRAVNWGERGATGCAESDQGQAESDQRMHPGVIYMYIYTHTHTYIHTYIELECFIHTQVMVGEANYSQAFYTPVR